MPGSPSLRSFFAAITPKVAVPIQSNLCGSGCLHQGDRKTCLCQYGLGLVMQVLLPFFFCLRDAVSPVSQSYMRGPSYSA